MKKSLIYALFILLSLIAKAHDFEVNGIFYNVNGSEVIVTYKGSDSDHANSYSGDVIIPLEVTYNDMTYPISSIGDYSFAWCYDLISVTIPNSINAIGIAAFADCKQLKSINIPNTITTINRATFSGCYRLSKIIIPNTVTTIENQAFQVCEALSKIEIPNSVTTIGFGAFNMCSSLTNIYIGKSVTSIGDKAFRRCDNIADIYSYALIPPTCDDNSFTTYSGTLHVPPSSLAAYFTAPYWCRFESIVGDAIAPIEITICKDSAEIQLNEQIVLTARVNPANATNRDIIWESSDTSVATVDNGLVKAVSYGECDIIASCFGMQAICHVSVVNRITLEQQEAMLLPNHMLTLTPSAPTMPNGFTVISSEPTVAAARVMNGKVQVVGIKEGTTTITVGSTDGTAIPATCLVTVYTEPGDLNSDGFVNISDVTSLIDYLLGGDDTQISSKNADVNGDGNISISDVTTLIDQLLSSGY